MPDFGVYCFMGSALPSELLKASSIAAAMTATAFLAMMLVDWCWAPWAEPVQREGEDEC